MMKQVWSCGGGVQSAAIAALVVQGRLPKPDLALIVDTEREKESTWVYCDSVLKPQLAKIGVDLIRVPKSQYATVDLYSGNGDLLIPAFTNKTGRSSKFPTFCSNEWKRRVIMRYLRDHDVDACQNWLGISVDEIKRVRTGPPAWFQPRYVLIYDVPMYRRDCVKVVEDMGWPAAPRSSCWMCPNQGDQEWAAMSESDVAKAVEFERGIQAQDVNVFLHRSCQPIGQVQFNGAVNDDDGCQSGFCFT